jgi:hypothetical protein
MLQVKNRASSTLASGIDDNDLALTVATGEGVKFPTTYPFHVTIDDEILECTDVTGDVLTVTREAEGTTAAAHLANASVNLNITAQIITELQSAASITDITYANLVTAIGADGLTKGSFYRITDYVTKHYIVDGYNTRYDDIVTGAAEPLIVLALDVDKIDKQAYSENYPQDIIYYDWNPAHWETDPAFWSVGAETPAVVTGFKGVIYYRDDTLQNNSCAYDFRNCEFRRWEAEPAEWQAETAYSQGDYVKETSSSNYVYRALQAVPDSGIGYDDTAYWVALIDISTYVYWNAAPDSWNNITSGVAYDDFKTFAENGTYGLYSRQCFSNRLDTGIENQQTYTFLTDCSPSILANNVIWLPDSDSNIVFGNKMSTACTSNTINGLLFFYNNFDHDCSYNTIGDSFYYNTIGNSFSSNTIGNSFYYNTIGNSFSSNTIGNSFYYNMIGNNFSSNTIGNYFYSNTIGNYFISNTIVDSFQLNNIPHDFNGSGGSPVDFTSAAYVYLAYNKELYRRPDGTQKLRYYDDSDTLVIVAANA